MNKRVLGNEKETEACKYLACQGMVILERNYRVRAGEIDIIGQHEGYIVFVEVKYRKNNLSGNALEAVNIRKQKQIIRVSDYYRYEHKLGANTAVRYDVVAILDSEITWIKNAFGRSYF